MKQTFKKSVSFLLTFAMLSSFSATMPLSTFAAGVDYNHNASTSTDEYYKLIAKTDWDNAPGITESEIVLNNDAGDYRQVIHIMKADVNNSYVNVIPTYSEMNTSKYQTGTMLDQANWIDENMDGEVIGTMNCCLSWYTGYPGDRVGEPLGFMMLNDEIMFDPGNCGYDYGNVGFPTCVVINKDVNEAGEERPIDVPKLEMVQIRTSADLDGWENTVIPISSGYIVKDGENQYKATHKDNDAPRSVVGITADGQVVMMENDGRQSPFSAGMNMYDCAEVMIAAGCVWAANCDGGGSSTFVSQRPGEDLKVNNSPSDGGLRPSTSGICFISTAPADGQFYKAHISAENEYYTPNSKVLFDAVGTDMSGAVVEIPADAEWQLVDDSFGSIEDGVFTSNGKEGMATVQLVYNGEVVGEASITIVLPEIAFRNETIVIGYGDTMALPIDVTTNEGRNTVVYDSDDIVYTLSDKSLGTIVGDQFTACDASNGLTEGIITAVICGQETKKATANIRFGKASEIIYDFEDGELPVDTSNTGNIGGDDAEDTGEYIYGWHIADTRKNGYYAYRYYAKKSYTPVGLDIPTELKLVDKNTGMVRNGNYAMSVNIDWTNVTASCHGQMDLALPESLDLTDATSVGFWLYIPAELVTASMQVSAGFKGGRVDYKLPDVLSKDTGIDNGGWYYFSWDVLDTYKSLEYIQINSHYTAGVGNYNYYQDVTYYIDDLTVDYSDATIDRENPYFTSMTIADEYTNGVEVSGQTINTNTITLMAQACENTTKANATGLNLNSVKLYVDGVLSNADISMANNGTITVSNLYLNDGVHTLAMEISDIQGNVGNIARKVTVNTDKSDVRLEVSDPNATLLPTGSIYWLNLVADNLSSISSVTTTINLDYVNDWELEGMEVAYGFKAEYFINNHNDAVITFTRTGTEVSDTTILAKLPVRIWMAKGWMNDSGIRKDYISDDPAKQDKYWILTPHAMWYSDGTRDYRLVVSAEAGVVTYVDGTTTTFSANETVLQTEMNRYYTNADRQNKWSFHICTPGDAQSKAPTCTENGYENRVFCVGCSCGSVENLGTECDNHNGCGSVIDWGTTIPAMGHEYVINVDSKLTCVNGGELFSGVYTDGKTYLDGVLIEDGWNADNTAYYVNGVKLVGSHLIDGKMCTFDANGVYLPDYIYDGWYEIDETVMYFVNNKQLTGYQKLDTKPYYFDEDGKGYEGEYTIDGKACLFDNGLFVSCEDETVIEAGWCGAEWNKKGLHAVEYMVYSNASIRITGSGDMMNVTEVGVVPWSAHVKTFLKTIFIGKDITRIGNHAFRNCFVATSVVFDENSSLNYIGMRAFYNMRALKCIVLPDSVETLRRHAFGQTYGLKYIYLPMSLINIEKDAFYAYKEGLVLEVEAGSVAESYAQTYGIPYKNPVVVLKNGIYQEEGKTYYYVDGVRTGVGLVKIDGYYYYASTGGVCKTGKYWVSRTNDLLKAGYYFFNEDGKMDIKNGVYAEDGAVYYYVDGVRTSAGLVNVDGYYYYASTGGVCKTGKYWVSRTNDLLNAGYYFFNEDGKMDIKNGVYVEDDGIFYYVDGVRTNAGLVLFDGNYYYASSGGACKTGKYWVSRANELMPAGYYSFDAETGKMIF